MRPMSRTLLLLLAVTQAVAADPGDQRGATEKPTAPSRRQFKTFSIVLPPGWRLGGERRKPTTIGGWRYPVTVELLGPQGQYLNADVDSPHQPASPDGEWHCEVARGAVRVTAESSRCRPPAGTETQARADMDCGDGDGRLDLFALCGRHLFSFGNLEREHDVDLAVFRDMLSSVRFDEDPSPEPPTREECELADDDLQRILNLRGPSDPEGKRLVDGFQAHYRKYASFHRYCALGESKVAVVHTMLESYWPQAMRALDECDGDAQFAAFVLFGLSDFAGDQTYESIRAQAASHCPSRHAAFCQRVIVQCDSGLKRNEQERLRERAR